MPFRIGRTHGFFFGHSRKDRTSRNARSETENINISIDHGRTNSVFSLALARMCGFNFECRVGVFCFGRLRHFNGESFAVATTTTTTNWEVLRAHNQRTKPHTLISTGN